jgi:WhiB family redox-sensing transcriptional regulator
MATRSRSRYLIEPRGPAWAAAGACATAPAPDAWHPDRETAQAADQVRPVCATCPVAEACLDYAMGRPWLTGIWAGTTTHQRRLARRAANAAAATTAA